MRVTHESDPAERRKAAARHLASFVVPFVLSPSLSPFVIPAKAGIHFDLFQCNQEQDRFPLPGMTTVAAPRSALPAASRPTTAGDPQGNECFEAVFPFC